MPSSRVSLIDDINTDKEEQLKRACHLCWTLFKGLDGQTRVRTRRDALIKGKGLTQRQRKGGNDGCTEEEKLQK